MYLIHRQFDNFPQIEYWGPNHKQDMWCFGPRVLHNIDQEKTFWLEGNQHFLEKWLGKILEQMATLELKKEKKCIFLPKLFLPTVRKSFSRSLEQFILTLEQNNLCDKIPFLQSFQGWSPITMMREKMLSTFWINKEQLNKFISDTNYWI